MFGISFQSVLIANPRLTAAMASSTPSGGYGDNAKNGAATIGEALIKAAELPSSPSAVVQLSSLGKNLSAGLAQDSGSQDALYGFDSLGAGAALGKGARTVHQGAVADRALVSALMLAITNANWQDKTSAMALQTNPAMSGL
jgi:hypothetical protein